MDDDRLSDAEVAALAASRLGGQRAALAREVQAHRARAAVADALLRRCEQAERERDEAEMRSDAEARIRKQNAEEWTRAEQRATAAETALAAEEAEARDLLERERAAYQTANAVAAKLGAEVERLRALLARVPDGTLLKPAAAGKEEGDNGNG